MADPFASLRAPLSPVQPEPEFAASLRTRLERALGLSKGDTPVTTQTVHSEPTQHVAIGSLTPYLAVTDARQAIDWYVQVLGASRRGEPYIIPDGRVGHAELDISGAVLMLADEFPEIGHTAPLPDQGASVSLRLEVRDVDATAQHAVNAGATLVRAPADSDYGRGATIRDPFGHRWLLAGTPVARHPNGTRAGDVGYDSFEVPDLAQAMAFYADVLGWTYSPGSADQGRQVEQVTPMAGLWGGQPRGEHVLTWRVDDIASALQRVRDAGGTAAEPEVTPYGATAACVDDQGIRFYLWQPTPEQAERERDAHDRAVNGSRHGDMSYLTLEVRDVDRTRAFYGAVLGWTCTPGSVANGWEVDGIMPMTGLWGGQRAAAAVPVYRVDDIYTAVERVRAAGGTATEPHQEPYGILAECTDNQGTRFGLGQH
jgi:predicted enzyme related to lactoylglutathione lyase